MGIQFLGAVHLLVKRIFAAIIIVDVTLLVAPTRWMGSNVEAGIASALALATALLWLGLRFNEQDS